jgi:hypothetical protein
MSLIGERGYADVAFTYNGKHCGELHILIDNTGVLLSLRGPKGGQKGVATAAHATLAREGSTETTTDAPVS